VIPERRIRAAVGLLQAAVARPGAGVPPPDEQARRAVAVVNATLAWVLQEGEHPFAALLAAHGDAAQDKAMRRQLRAWGVAHDDWTPEQIRHRHPRIAALRAMRAELADFGLDADGWPAEEVRRRHALLVAERDRQQREVERRRHPQLVWRRDGAHRHVADDPGAGAWMITRRGRRWSLDSPREQGIARSTTLSALKETARVIVEGSSLLDRPLR
jgi:hypothetical protein